MIIEDIILGKSIIGTLPEDDFIEVPKNINSSQGDRLPQNTEIQIFGNKINNDTCLIKTIVPQQPIETFERNFNLELQKDSPKLADLKVRFGKMELPDTVEFGDRGKVQVVITNRGNKTARGPIAIDLWNSTDGNIDKNDSLLTTKLKYFNLKPGESVTVGLEYKNITSTIAPGAYRLIATIDSQECILEKNENNNIVSKLVSAPNTDVVIDWNATALNAIQAEGEAGREVPPTVGSRALAIVSTAIYDTVNAFTNTHKTYAVDMDAPKGASLEAAVAGAAYWALSKLFPEQKQMFPEQLMKSLSPESADNLFAKMLGANFGLSVADRLLELRATDGWDDNTPYTPPMGDYIWHPDANGTAIGPNWGKVTPWAISNVESFAPDGMGSTPTQNSSVYAQEIEEVRIVGGRFNTDVTTINRTADQTELTYFWAYDRADTFRPYGQLNQIAEEIAVREDNSLEENARLFAALNVALADSAIVAWHEKYHYYQPRPDDVIAGGIAANDNMPETISDPNWKPLLDTPPFPDYMSGHSTFGGAFAGVLTYFYGENYHFQAVSQELPGVIRSFDSFNEAAYEDAVSRVYGGVHVREASVTDALPTGLAIGNFVAENFFQPI